MLCDKLYGILGKKFIMAKLKTVLNLAFIFLYGKGAHYKNDTVPCILCLPYYFLTYICIGNVSTGVYMFDYL